MFDPDEWRNKDWEFDAPPHQNQRDYYKATGKIMPPQDFENIYASSDGSMARITENKNHQGYKFDYYDKDPRGQNKGELHNSNHTKSDINENWTRAINNRDEGTQTHDSGSGCYLTTACMQHYKDNFDDKCFELLALRWFRDNFVSEEDIAHYYAIAPAIVEAIENEPNQKEIFESIYNVMIIPSIEHILNDEYGEAYKQYKEYALQLERAYAPNAEKRRVLAKA